MQSRKERRGPDAVAAPGRVRAARVAVARRAAWLTARPEAWAVPVRPQADPEAEAAWRWEEQAAPALPEEPAWPAQVAGLASQAAATRATVWLVAVPAGPAADRDAEAALREAVLVSAAAWLGAAPLPRARAEQRVLAAAVEPGPVVAGGRVGERPEAELPWRAAACAGAAARVAGLADRAGPALRGAAGVLRAGGRRVLSSGEDQALRERLRRHRLAR